VIPWIDGVLLGLIAGKPAPTVIGVNTKFVHTTEPVGAGLARDEAGSDSENLK